MKPERAKNWIFFVFLHSILTCNNRPECQRGGSLSSKAVFLGEKADLWVLTWRKNSSISKSSVVLVQKSVSTWLSSFCTSSPTCSEAASQEGALAFFSPSGVFGIVYHMCGELSRGWKADNFDTSTLQHFKRAVRVSEQTNERIKTNRTAFEAPWPEYFRTNSRSCRKCRNAQEKKASLTGHSRFHRHCTALYK